MDAIDELLGTYDLDEEAREAMVRMGLMHRVNQLLTEERFALAGSDGGTDGVGAIDALHGAPAPPRRLRLALAMTFRAADGLPKPLSEFTAKDVAYLQRVMRSSASAFERRARALERLRVAMDQHSAEKVAHLPADVLEHVATDLAKAWSK